LFSASLFAVKSFADPAPVVQGNLVTNNAVVSEQALVTSGDADTNSNTQMADTNDNAAMQNLPPSELQLYNQLQQVQQQMRDLQGQLEVQGHQIQVLQQTQTSAKQDAPQVAMPVQTITPAQVSGATESKTNASTSAASQTPTTQKAKQSLDEQALYQQGYQSLVDKKYGQAQAEMQDYIQKYPKGEYAANAYYWSGELYLISGDSTNAMTQFQSVVTKFGNSGKAADAMLKIGYIYYTEQQYNKAESQLQKLVKDYPSSSSAELAKQKLAMMQAEGNV